MQPPGDADWVARGLAIASLAVTVAMFLIRLWLQRPRLVVSVRPMAGVGASGDVMVCVANTRPRGTFVEEVGVEHGTWRLRLRALFRRPLSEARLQAGDHERTSRKNGQLNEDSPPLDVYFYISQIVEDMDAHGSTRLLGYAVCSNGRRTRSATLSRERLSG